MSVAGRRARCPASSANLGAGFDTLAVALALHVEVEVRPAERLRVRAEGEGSDLPTDRTHLAARVAIDVAGTEALDITVRSAIPVARGLGSSAALAVAAAAAAGSADPLAVGARIDGHAENAGASVLGGLVTATMVAGRPVASRLPLDDGLAFVVVVPDRPLHTRQARMALPATVPHADAAFNLGRMGMLVAGLADRRLLVPEATEDRLHERQRSPLFPEAPRLLAGLVAAGARAACWSGAGPALLAVCDAESAEDVRVAGEKLLAEECVPGRSVVLAPDLAGLVVEPI
ncbi:MAG TPA: homoserine kinase [Acidimicrobiales bacterium]|nr:homoserine kinase [Acidimicrobiales bacterium]